MAEDSPHILSEVLTSNDTIRNFMREVALAKKQGQDWVETSKEVIEHFNPDGLGGRKYFCFNGVKVCEHGESEKIAEELAEPIAAKIWGRNVKLAKVEGLE